MQTIDEIVVNYDYIQVYSSLYAYSHAPSHIRLNTSYDHMHTRRPRDIRSKEQSVVEYVYMQE